MAAETRGVLDALQQQGFGAVVEELGEANESRVKYAVEAAKVTDEDRRIAVDDEGFYTIVVSTAENRPANATLEPLETLSLSAEGKTADGTVGDVSRVVVWSSSAQSVARVDRSGATAGQSRREPRARSANRQAETKAAAAGGTASGGIGANDKQRRRATEAAQRLIRPI